MHGAVLDQSHPVDFLELTESGEDKFAEMNTAKPKLFGVRRLSTTRLIAQLVHPCLAMAICKYLCDVRRCNTGSAGRVKGLSSQKVDGLQRMHPSRRSSRSLLY